MTCTAPTRPRVPSGFSDTPNITALNGHASDYRSQATDTIGTTSNHPFWSVDRQAYVQAGLLRIGERLHTYSGDTKRVISKLARPGPQPVYNLEVFAEHVYYVGRDGVLVHNTYDSKYVYGLFKDDALVYVGSGDFKRAVGSNSALQRVAKAKFGGNVNLAEQNGYSVRHIKLDSEFQARGVEQKLMDYFGGPTYGRKGIDWNKIDGPELWNKNCIGSA